MILLIQLLSRTFLFLSSCVFFNQISYVISFRYLPILCYFPFLLSSFILTCFSTCYIT
ncbi:hypothetical protein C1646_164088 [Rhizophagus diaphanus]|nr:hypothetical protein C1646_164088 [Rhizophagus diaphanus] [Rhizophagus sp. MUCL 43196]